MLQAIASTGTEYGINGGVGKGVREVGYSLGRRTGKAPIRSIGMRSDRDAVAEEPQPFGSAVNQVGRYSPRGG